MTVGFALQLQLVALVYGGLLQQVSAHPAPEQLRPLVGIGKAVTSRLAISLDMVASAAGGADEPGEPTDTTRLRRQTLVGV